MQERAKHVGVWIRVSTEDQARGESPEHHERRALAYAEARGWKVAETYRLEAVSGKAVMAHPEAGRMIADIQSGRISGLIFSKLARLGRSTKELLEFAELFRAAGADMVSLAEAIDTSTPAGRLFFTVIAAMAQWEREEIADRVAATVPIRAKMGKSTGGAAPYGYRWVDKRLEIDPEEAPVRVLIYELFAEHSRIKRVARIVNERGYRTRKGTPFSDTSVRRLIEDGTAKGLRRVNYSHTTDNKRAWTLKPEGDWIYQPTPALVSEELWERCNQVLASNEARSRSRTRSVTHLFAGFAYCACGTKMYVWSNSPKYQCSTCRNKIPVADLEAVYREQLQHFLLSPDEIDAHAQAAQDAIGEKQALLATAEEDLRRVAVEDERLYQLYQADGLSLADFKRRHAPISARRAQLEEELPRLQAQLDVLKIGLLSQEERVSEAQSLTARWEQMSETEKRQIVETITERIIVGTEEVEINLLHIPMGGNGADKATNPQGFWAAISCTRAG